MLTQVISEMKKRFTENNELLLALAKSDDMNIDSLSPLEKIDVFAKNDEIEAELKTAKKFVEVERKRIEEKEIEEKKKKVKSVLEIIAPVKTAFPNVFKLYCAIETFGCSTAVNESAFSAVSRIDVVRRMSMTTKRLCNLSFLAYEKKILLEIDDKLILEKFKQKNRKILL